MTWSHDGLGWGGWLFMVLAMLAFWALVVWAVVLIFRGTKPEPDHSPLGRDPLEILDERFARGEIERDEYQARQEVLRTGGRVHA